MVGSEMDVLIDVDALGKTFQISNETGGLVALEDATLHVTRGSIVAILGASGCGKSTLLNIMAGLMQHTEGGITVLGDRPRPRPEVGLMFQKPLLFDWRNVLQNVLIPAEVMKLPKEEAILRARELLDLVGLTQFTKRYPWELSGGMQQRVALARVLLPDPELLLLDEPFGALDERTREALDVELQEIVQRTSKTVVLVTHSIYETVLVADKVYVMTPRPGRVAGVVDIPFSRPRTSEVTASADFAQKVGECRELLRADEEVSVV